MGVLCPLQNRIHIHFKCLYTRLAIATVVCLPIAGESHLLAPIIEPLHVPLEITVWTGDTVIKIVRTATTIPLVAR
jgi:hypothetical protein